MFTKSQELTDLEEQFKRVGDDISEIEKTLIKFKQEKSIINKKCKALFINESNYYLNLLEQEMTSLDLNFLLNETAIHRNRRRLIIEKILLPYKIGLFDQYNGDCYFETIPKRFIFSIDDVESLIPDDIIAINNFMEIVIKSTPSDFVEIFDSDTETSIFFDISQQKVFIGCCDDDGDLHTYENKNIPVFTSFFEAIQWFIIDITRV